MNDDFCGYWAKKTKGMTRIQQAGFEADMYAMIRGISGKCPIEEPEKVIITDPEREYGELVKFFDDKEKKQ